MNLITSLYILISCQVAIWLILICIPSTTILSETNSQDVSALLTLKQMWKNVPPSWNRGNDSCGGQWEGITCRDSRIISITLSSMGLIGILPGDIQGLSELETLDLSYNKGLSGNLPPEIGNLAKLTTLILAGCNFNGELPDTIGSLSKLVFLSLNSNDFSGTIPQTIGKLSELYWLDLAANKLTGNIPISPGLDMLVHAKLFHFGGNQLSGAIPPQLFNENMNLLHLLLDNNQLSGTIPTTLSLVRTLEVIRFDWNSLIGSVPLSINTLIVLKTLLLSNNKLAGVMPDLTGMNLLSYLDMSNNSFEVSDVPSWVTALPSLTTLMMEQSQIQGIIPSSFFGLPQLQKVTTVSLITLQGQPITISNSYGSESSSEAKSKSSGVRKVLAIIGGSIAGVIALISSYFAAESLISCYNDRSCNNFCNNCCSWNFGNRNTQKDEDDERQDKWILEFIRQRPRR
ncbi:leucine-rich repeat receptor protein kinase HPCA1-like isoform X7 [Silene latifolia]|uniref:leucine-rich repeat receptor protein kinase HPCA1-like isoform X7 n=1 Tax=Silene latifolia TaxID=37657 RepID=UPI003D789B55